MKDPICGTEYQSGSWSEWVHNYLYADSPEKIQDQLNQLQSDFLRVWARGMVTELKIHLPKLLERFEPNSQAWNFIVQQKWPLAGFLLTNAGQLQWAEKIFLNFYQTLCELQSSKGRIHKGDALFALANAVLNANKTYALEEARYYMRLALIEDMLTNPAHFKTLPAFQYLTGEDYRITKEEIEDFVDSMKKILDLSVAASRTLRPEIPYLEYIMESNRSEKLFGFDPAVASQLLERVESALKR